jgi:hypothetical protein
VNTATKLVGFGAIVALAFGVSLGLGEIVGPVDIGGGNSHLDSETDHKSIGGEDQHKP